MKEYEFVAHSGYSEKERELVKAYIMEQYAGKMDKVEVLSSCDPLVSVVKISGNECITYVTLGAGIYTIKNRFRKDLQNFEFVMVASKNISQTQEQYILKNIAFLLSNRTTDTRAAFELDTFQWIADDDTSPFGYSGFMILRSAEPLDIPKKYINFMVLLPLYKMEINSLWNRMKGDRLWERTPHVVMQEHKGELFKTLTDICAGTELLYVDKPREVSPYAMYDMAESVFGLKKHYVSWLCTLKSSRTLATALWRDIRSGLNVCPKKVIISKNFKYEECDGVVSIKGYVGTDLEVTVPEEIGGKPVVKIDWHAFSPETLPIYSRASEVRKMICKVTMFGPIKELYWHGFVGCESLGEVVVGKKVCLTQSLKDIFGEKCVFYVEKDSWAERECKRDGLKYEIIKADNSAHYQYGNNYKN